MTDLTFEGEMVVAYEHPLTRVLEIADTDTEADGMFIRLHSWSDVGNHKEIRAIEGKKVIVTVKVVDDE